MLGDVRARGLSMQPEIVETYNYYMYGEAGHRSIMDT